MTNVKRFGEKKQEMEDIEKFKSKILKGLADILFLQIVNQEAQYGYGIRQELEETYGIKLARVTCYLKLYKLEKLGFLKSRTTDVLSHTMKMRRYYDITNKGKIALNNLLDYLDKFELVHVKEKSTAKKNNQIIHPTS